MNLPRIYLIAMLLLAFSVGANSQGPPKAVLADEFGRISCEDLLARTDAFFAELVKYQEDTGYAIVYSGGRNPNGFKKFITANIYLRRFDRNRIRVVVATDTPGVDGQLWRVPSGAEPPKFTELPEPVRDISKPFIFGHHFDDNVCPSFVPELYSDLIKQNPGSRGTIVISGPDWRQRKYDADASLERFTNEFGLPRNRIRIYYVHRPKIPLTEAEYWFIPSGKR